MRLLIMPTSDALFSNDFEDLLVVVFILVVVAVPMDVMNYNTKVVADDTFVSCSSGCM